MNRIPPETYKFIFIGLAVVFGAIVNATAQFKVAGKSQTDYTMLDFLVNFVIATFAGGVFGTIGAIFFEDIKIVVLFASVGAFLGLAGLNKLATAGLETVLSRLQK